MSRIANKPVSLPKGVDVKIDGALLTVKGSKGELNWEFPSNVAVKNEDGEIRVSAVGDDKPARSMSVTARALINNMVTGVSEGFVRKLELVGV